MLFYNYFNILLVIIALISMILLLYPTIIRIKYNYISIIKAVNLINKSNAIILDIRENKEFIKGHLLKSNNIELNKLMEKIKKIPKNQIILLVCKTNMQLYNATKIIKISKHVNIYVLDGNIESWKQLGMPIIK